MGATKERERFERGMAHFNAGEFFEAHEVWEELWLRAAATEKAFLQGIIQIAAAFHHFKRGNEDGARSLLKGGLAKLSKYADRHCGIDAARLRQESQIWLKALETGQTPANARPPQIRRAPGTAEL
jgi:uncharacterized protein